jgi:hypothetical protein
MELAADPIAKQAKKTSEFIPVFTESLNKTHQLIGPISEPLGKVVSVTLTVNAKK